MSTISIPGFSNVMDPTLSPVKRFQWAAAMGICFALCVFHTKNRIETYFRYPTILSNEYQSQEQSPIFFPLVTLCPQEAFNNRDLYELRMAHVFPNGTVPTVYDLLDYDGIDVDRIWKLSGFNYTSYINSCTYSSQESCGDSVFWKEKYTIMGRCNTLYIRNSAWYHGPHNGIVLNITDAWFDRTDVLNDFKSNLLLLRAQIHDREDDVRYTVGYRGRYVIQQSSTIITYTQSTYLGLNSHKRPCNAKILVTRCTQRCYDDYILTHITQKCRLPFMKYYAEEYPLCSTSDQLKPFLQDHKPHSETIRQSGCDKKCGRSCNINQFDTKIDMANNPKSEKYTFIYIYPSTNGVSFCQEKYTFSIFQLFCDFGALFGIYMGISLLTVAEILEYLLQIIINRINDIKIMKK